MSFKNVIFIVDIRRMLLNTARKKPEALYEIPFII